MAELTIEVKTLSDQAAKGFKDVGSKIEDLTKKATGFSDVSRIAFGSFIGSLASQATTAAFGFFKSGLTEIKDYFIDSVKAAAEAETSLNDFNTSLALSGRYTKEVSDDFVRFAGEMQNVSLYGDDVILKNAGLLQSFAKLDTEGLKNATKSAIDFSAVTGKDLSTTMDLLAKAATGNTEMLQRYGIVIKKTGDTSKDFETVLKTINEQFGGAAESKINTFTGSLTQMSEVWGDLKESIGAIISDNPIVIASIKILKDVFLALKDVIDQNRGSFTGLISEGMIKLISIIPTLISGVSTISDLFSTSGRLTNFFVDKLLSLTEAFYKYRIAITEVHKNLVEYLGGQTKFQDKIIKDSQKEIDIITQAKLKNDELNASKISSYEKYSNAVKDFSDKTNNIIKTQFENAMSLSNKETKNFLTNLSLKNQGRKAADRNAAEEAKKAAAEAEAAAKKAAEDEKKYLIDIKKQKEDILSGGIAAFGAENKVGRELSKEEQKEFNINKNIGGGIGVATSVLGGSDGALNLLKGGAELIGGPIGKAVGPIIDALGKGPDAVKGFISDFVDSVPVLVLNIVESVPAIINAIVDKIPVLINSIIASTPRIINSLVEKLPIAIQSFASSMPTVAISFATSLIKNIPSIVSSMAQGAFNAFSEVLSSLNPFGGGDSKFLGLFAEGGYVKKVPGGFPNDSFPARLTEGEFVVDRTTSKKLESFLDNQGGGNNELLFRILDAVTSPIIVDSSVQVNQQTFANIILELNRQNRRLTI